MAFHPGHDSFHLVPKYNLPVIWIRYGLRYGDCRELLQGQWVRWST